MEELEGEVCGDAVDNHLYAWLVKVEGEGHSDAVEVLTDFAIRLGGGKVFHQYYGHVAAVFPDRGLGELDGEYGGGLEGRVDCVS